VTQTREHPVILRAVAESRPNTYHLFVVFDNVNSDRVKRYRSLQQASARRRNGLFLVEGPQSVRELVQFCPGAIETLYLTPDSVTRYPEILAAANSNFTLATDEVIKSISENAQQVLAIADVNEVGFNNDWSVPNTPGPLIAILHNVRDPGNAGTVIRTADAAGAELVILTGDSVEITNPKVIRSTAGSAFHVPVRSAQSLPQVIETLKSEGWQVLAAAGGGATILGDASLDLSNPTAWVFGNEARGLTEDEAALVDKSVSIPIFGEAESLNLATAAAICLYASALAQHRV